MAYVNVKFLVSAYVLVCALERQNNERISLLPASGTLSYSYNKL